MKIETRAMAEAVAMITAMQEPDFDACYEVARDSKDQTALAMSLAGFVTGILDDLDGDMDIGCFLRSMGLAAARTET